MLHPERMTTAGVWMRCSSCRFCRELAALVTPMTRRIGAAPSPNPTSRGAAVVRIRLLEVPDEAALAQWPPL